MVDYLSEGVELNKQLIKEDQIELQVQLEDGLIELKQTLEGLISSVRRKKRPSMIFKKNTINNTDAVEEPGIHFLNHLL